MTLARRPRRLSDAEKIGCLMKTCRTKEREAWLCCLQRHGFTLWAA